MGLPDYTTRAILQGIYEGQAVNLACDEQGRLILIAEPVSPFDKAGTIVYREQFNEGLIHATVTEGGTGADVSVINSESYAGSWSCQLTGGSDGTKNARLTYYIQMSSFAKQGVEFSIRWGTHVDTFDVILLIYDGTSSHQAWLRYQNTGNKWTLYDALTEAFVTILEYPASIQGNKWFHTCKLVFDLETDLFHTFRYVGGVIDLSVYGLETAVSVAVPRMEVNFTLTSDAGNNAVVVLDDLIFTQDES